jgi:hypothetical protein
MAAGMSEEDATRRAIDEFGGPELVRHGMEDIYGRRMITLLIEKAMEWKERAMKTNWNWGFAAQMALASVLVLEVMFIGFMFFMLVPMIQQIYNDLGAVLPVPLIILIHYFDALQRNWFIYLLPIAGWIAFEWKYRGEHKALIRLTVGGFVSLGLLALLCFASTILYLATVSTFQKSQRIENIVAAKVAHVRHAYDDLERQIQNEDWARSDHAAQEVARAVQKLRESGVSAVLLTGNRYENIDAIRNLLDQIQGYKPEDADKQSIGRYDRLKDAYGRLEQLSPYFDRTGFANP